MSNEELGQARSPRAVNQLTAMKRRLHQRQAGMDHSLTDLKQCASGLINLRVELMGLLNGLSGKSISAKALSHRQRMVDSRPWTLIPA